MKTLARWLGVALQSIVLGTLLAVAILRLLAVAGSEFLFHYQGF